MDSFINPALTSSTFMIPPSGDNATNTRLAATTQEIKCGKYEMVLIERLMNLFLTSFSITASAIDATKPKTSFKQLITNVFLNPR